MNTSYTYKILTALLAVSLLACFGGEDSNTDTQDAEPLTCAEASAEEVGVLFELKRTCTTDDDCTVIATGCDCPILVNRSSNTDNYLKARQEAMSLCGDAYFENCGEVECLYDVDETNVVCNQGICDPASTN